MGGAVKRYTDKEVWEFMRTLPRDVGIAMSSEGAMIVQQAVDELEQLYAARSALPQNEGLS